MRWIFSLLAVFLLMGGFSQKNDLDNQLRQLAAQKDSTLKSLQHADSVKTDMEFASREKWARLEALETFPLFHADKFSGVLPVKDPTEIPDPNLQYKLLFEVTVNNPDSTMGSLNEQLFEVARILNLHIASGIPLKNLTAVVVVHGAVLHILTQNDSFRKKYKTDNPNINLIGEMARAGVRFIACGQAMQFFDIPRDSLLPVIKVSLTAQTVLSSYQLKGFVLMELR
jgi:intracellular sulfur oxidation DsrE/DsrF family protein